MTTNNLIDCFLKDAVVAFESQLKQESVGSIKALFGRGERRRGMLPNGKSARVGPSI